MDLQVREAQLPPALADGVQFVLAEVVVVVALLTRPSEAEGVGVALVFSRVFLTTAGEAGKVETAGFSPSKRPVFFTYYRTSGSASGDWVTAIEEGWIENVLEK